MAKKKVDVTKMLTRAKDALDRHNYDLAIFNYLQALTLQPENLDARIKLRATQNRHANENGASMAKAIVPLLKAMLLNALGKSEQALVAAEGALKHVPASTFALKLVAKCAEKAELTEVAAWQRQEIADKYDQEDIDNLDALAELYLELDRGNEAIACYERMKKIDPDADVDAAIREASARATSTIYETAARDGARTMIKDEEEAEFLEMDPTKLRSDDQRLKYINYRLEHDAVERPDDYRVFAGVADIYFMLEDFATGYVEAKKNYERAMELNSTDSTLRDKVGDLEMKKMRLDVRDLQAKRKEAPGDEALKKKYAAAVKTFNDYQIEEYERRVREQPLKAVFHYKLGDLYFQRKRYEESISELQLAAKDPKFRLDTLTTLGRCFLGTEQIEMAIAQFQRAQEGQEIFQKAREPMYYEAAAYETLGDAESLKKSLAIFTKIYEDDINYKDVKAKVPELQKRIKELGAAAS